MRTATILLVLAALGCADAPDRDAGGNDVDGDLGPGARPPADAVDTAPHPDAASGADPDSRPRRPADVVAAPGAAGEVRIWLSRGESPVPVRRSVDPASPQGALDALLAGPTEIERAEGLTSWFSDETARALGSTSLRDGFLVVDFRGLDALIPGAGSSAGSEQLLTALDSTVFQFEAVDSVEYRLDGSCRAFWEWLQRSCAVVHR